MSIPVDVTRLAEALTDFGSGYLLTVSPAGRVKAFTVDPVVRDGLVVVAAASRGTAANLAANDAVTLVLPPRERHGYTLLVDGTGRALGDEVEITPGRPSCTARPRTATARCHRPRPPARVRAATTASRSR
ncbi:MAG: pyridoxamine 5'-phosphate oxidase family protein [Nocardioides sp.]